LAKSEQLGYLSAS